MRICLVSREVAPFGGGGIGVYVTALAGLLRDVADVTVITVGDHREPFDRLLAAGDPRVPAGVTFHFVPAPDLRAVEHAFGYHHVWAASVLAAVEELYGDDGPELIEVPDYHAEGFVLVQAKLARHRSLRDTRLVARAHTSWEMCALLDGHIADGRDERALTAMERHVLQHVDHVLWAGGDILGTYERYYGRAALAAPRHVRHPAPILEATGEAQAAAPDDAPVKLLFVGRLERRKGVLELIRAFQRSARDDTTLTLAGGDTDSGPTGSSMQATLELMTLGDDRIRLLGALPGPEIGALLAEHDVVIAPSRWECWPYSVLEALQANRPVLATRVGGHAELVRPGETGWLVAPGEDSLADALDVIQADPAAARAMARSGAGAGSLAELTDPGAIVAAYLDLAAPRRRAMHVPRERPLVSAIVPYKGMAAHVEEAVASLQAQTYPRLETVVVCDGSFDPADSVLHELEASVPRLRVLWQSNRGLGGARNAGIVQSRGRYLFALDADNVAEPEFVERSVELLEDDPSLGYVTAWSRYVDEQGRDLLDDLVIGYQPLGNFTELVDEFNTAGDAAAVWPRRLFDLGFRYDENVAIIEDWTLYRKMREAGLYGRVIPERLMRYRVRPDSMYQVETGRVRTLLAQATAELRLGRIEWSSSV